MDYENITFEKDEHIGILTINRPDVRNALSPQTFMEIRDAIRICRFDKDIRVVVITGAGGKAFASGADIRSLKERETLEVLKSEAQDALNAIENLDKPVIAAIDGYALGGGCELAMACDIRIATRRSKLGQPEVNLGIIPGLGGTQRLQRLVGLGKAKELIFTGEIISAEQAESIGLINRVVSEPQDLMPAVKEMAQKIISKAPVAVSLAKAALNVGANVDIHSGLVFERHAQAIAFSTDDRIEGTSAFLEKRKPNFKGK
ncbi:MAG: enoyl-CoA hydratase/isomerase family protein [Deltaproteobacteria bacterium]|nr:enoyl-CoA hydratase/isomerase family protein [Deltaproteobacteria bacterium]MBW1962853.1 enoyl-CoA hydratase/isomerase family protein [Deltaproteobacteria bacterium]MBW1993429.1 enoyl-CoA hydratase/isomerase family protein [Deltaproteobacteria bacterium]MBW2150544.1 enoyl-CoA hydratase/isomerase family protein [Deltaproteobacteria bacterium]